LEILIPNNFILLGSYEGTVNGEAATMTGVDDDFLIKVVILQGGLRDFDIIISKGLQNPEYGPYSYSGFSFEFQTIWGSAIDAVITEDLFSVVNCDGLCSGCSPTLDTCLQCGADLYTQIVSYLYDSTCVEDCPSGWFGSTGYQCE
jgi:hypothetical protein